MNNNSQEKDSLSLEIQDTLRSLKAKGLIKETIKNGELAYEATALGEEIIKKLSEKNS